MEASKEEISMKLPSFLKRKNRYRVLIIPASKINSIPGSSCITWIQYLSLDDKMSSSTMNQSGQRNIIVRVQS